MNDSRKNKPRILFLCVLAVGILVCFTLIYQPDGTANRSDSLADFNFCLNFNTYGRDQDDTYKGTFTKDLVLDGTKTIDFKLPDDIMKQIFDVMKEMDIMSFPDTLSVEGVYVTPSCDYKLTVSMNGKTKTITWSGGFYPSMDDSGLTQRNKDFLRLVRTVSDYIYNTDTYKNMPAANGGYD
jgi:hypothetical protein